MRAARYDLPLMLAIIGGDPRRFRPYVDLYHRAFEQLGKPVQPIGVHSPGYVADTDEQARDGAVARLQAHARPDRRRARLAADGTRASSTAKPSSGSLYVGSPETVARKIAATAKALGVARFDMKYSAGTLSHEKMMRSIELYGRQGHPAGAGHAGVTSVAP